LEPMLPPQDTNLLERILLTLLKEEMDTNQTQIMFT
jgi:hypothetical protein